MRLDPSWTSSPVNITLGRMPDRWGPESPPEEAYSRHTRDLAAVTAEFAVWLEELPRRLTREFECTRRDLTADERARLLPPVPDSYERGYAVEPSDPASATLLVVRHSFEGGTGVAIGFGRAVVEDLPHCFCDACDEDSAGLIEQTQRIVDAATLGAQEFRRPHLARPGITLMDGPWLEQGYLLQGGGGSAWSNREVAGEFFDVQWRPWPRRMPTG